MNRGEFNLGSDDTAEGLGDLGFDFILKCFCLATVSKVDLF